MSSTASCPAVASATTRSAVHHSSQLATSTLLLLAALTTEGSLAEPSDTGYAVKQDQAEVARMREEYVRQVRLRELSAEQTAAIQDWPRGSAARRVHHLDPVSAAP
jgi:hypothetical protein